MFPTLVSSRRLGFSIAIIATLTIACGGGGGGSGNPIIAPPPPPVAAAFTEVSATSLPQASLGGMCMDAESGDVDGDGDIDLALAQEFGTNLVFINDGAGNFSVLAGAVMGGNGDNEDVLLRDFDGDGDLDMLTVHEDDAVHALLLNSGSGQFIDASSRLPLNSIANAAEATDLNGDGRLDILLGNQGVNSTLMQQADGSFVDDTAARPIGAGITQDLLLVDIDGDSDLDLFVANEATNQLFVNNGSGVFSDESSARLPTGARESREADAADVDNDGDMDIVIANVRFNTTVSLQNQLLLNDGNGNFSDVTAASLANVSNASNSFTIRFVDLDADGDPDVLSAANVLGVGGAVNVWINNGSGVFGPSQVSVFSTAPSGSVFDFEVADFDGDGNDDIYFCHRTGTDQLYVRR